MEKKHMVPERGTEEMEGARRATGISSVSDPAAGHRDLHAVPDPEVPEKAARRRFTAAYKIRILKEAEGVKGRGNVGLYCVGKGFIRRI